MKCVCLYFKLIRSQEIPTKAFLRICNRLTVLTRHPIKCFKDIQNRVNF